MGEDRERRNARMREYVRARRAAGLDRSPSRGKIDRSCSGCGATIRVRADKSTTRCSACTARVGALAQAEARRRRTLPVLFAYPRGAVPVYVPPSRPRWYAGYCRRCSAPFVSDRANVETCSDACIQRDKGERRRARKAGAGREPVRRAEIFARDEYRCRLCLDPLAMAERVPHPLAPTIDHVIPLAKGGRHAPDNVQAAHFLCNSRKRDLLEVA